MKGRIGYLRLVYRVPLLLLHIIIGTPATVLCQTAPGRSIRLGGKPLSDIMICWWGGTICRIFGLERRVHGAFGSGAQLVAANHISWLDIHLLLGVSAMGFVAKAEISRWPLVGWLAKAGGTVFHQRGSHDSASGVTAAMARRLREGRKVAIFPEGGILEGSGVKYFHARMFASAIESRVPVQPVMLRYQHGGARYDDITFLPGEHFLANVFRLLMQERCTAEVRVLASIDPAGKQRRQVASEAETAVREAFGREMNDG
jgi:1-acyl-sn-glycerol-3-phosphate acyltransferase